VSKELHDLAERLQKARTDDDYVETDLEAWTTKLEKLKCYVGTVSPLISICEDPTKVLIAKMYVPSTRQNLTQEERFGEFKGNIRIEDNGRVASHIGLKISDAYVLGKEEYSNDKHKILFIINKKTALYNMSFGIISKSSLISVTALNRKNASYGWHTDDGTINPDQNYQNSELSKDLQGETTFQLEFLIDCDNRKISYFNERTNNRREMKVNINKCPFPWQLIFYLYSNGDRVQLVSSSQVL
jgi:hypothetical protein